MRHTPLALTLLILATAGACQKAADGSELGSRNALSPRTMGMEFGASGELLLTQTLEHEVGTWEEPKLPADWLGVEETRAGTSEKVKELLLNGRRQFENSCVECHGWAGRGDVDGAHPMADVNSSADAPAPARDFSLGFTKYKSTPGQAFPTQADLQAFLTRPISQRPADGCKGIAESDSPLPDYLKYLLMRHSLENRVAAALDQIGIFRTSQDAVEHEMYVMDAVAVGIPSMLAAKLPEVDFVFETPSNADRGRKIFESPGAQCATCHGMDGKGRGIAAWEPSLSKYILKDMWGNPAKPTDFTSPPLRGGDAAVDIARSISVGVGGTPMASYGSTLTTLQIADLVAYISSFAGD